MELIGLILIGGQSKRMGHDKSLIKYHHETQRDYLIKLLNPICKNVYLSCNNEQAKDIHHPLIIDNECKGPITGILSGLENLIDHPLLVIACDMPLLDRELLNQLIAQRDISKMVTCYAHDWVEPLCSIWEPASYKALQQYYKQERLSLQKFIRENPSKLIQASESQLIKLKNVNTMDER